MSNITSLLFVLGVYAAAFDDELEWLIVRGISEYAGSSGFAGESWERYANVMAASLVTHILNDPIIFADWRNYEGTNDHKDVFILRVLFCLVCI